MKKDNAERVRIYRLSRGAPDDLLGDSPDHPRTQTQGIEGYIPVDRVLAVHRGPLLAYPRYHNKGYAIDRVKRGISPLLNDNDLCHTEIQVMEVRIAKDHQ